VIFPLPFSTTKFAYSLFSRMERLQSLRVLLEARKQKVQETKMKR
jgi:hypothetical protein